MEILPDPRAIGRRGERARLLWGALVLAMSMTVMVVSLTGAIFTDTQSVGANTFTTGTVDISTAPLSALVSLAGMAPGDKSENSVTVNNAGSLQLRYSIQRSATNADLKALRDSLRLRTSLRGGLACDFPFYTAAGATTVHVDDTQLYEGLGFPAAATNTVGDSAQGSQAGDRVLAAAATEVLCLSVILPTSAGNALQNAASTATLDFSAEQTANN